MTTVLEAQGLSYCYPGGVVALNRLDLRVSKGRRLAILGPNGAGKTTLLLHLNGTLRPVKGRVLFDGVPAGYDQTALNNWRRRVGLVLQDADDQLFASSVAEDVSFGPFNLGLDEPEVRRRVQDALAALDLSGLADRPTHMLSFGQKKRVAIAGAFAMRPELLLLDEPTAGLDAQGAALLIDEMERLNARGTTLVFTTHDADFAWTFADEVALFGDGRILAQGAAHAILTDSSLLATVGLAPPLLARLLMILREQGLIEAKIPQLEAEAVFALFERYRTEILRSAAVPLLVSDA